MTIKITTRTVIYAGKKIAIVTFSSLHVLLLCNGISQPWRDYFKQMKQNEQSGGEIKLLLFIYFWQSAFLK